MATWTFVKKSGAPVGTITITVESGTFPINDTTTTSISTTNPQTAGELNSSPYLTLSGISGISDPNHQYVQVILEDGVISKALPTGLVPFDGSELPFLVGSGASALTPTSVKTSSYTAAAGEFVPFDLSGGVATLTLPTAPADKTLVGFKLIAQAVSPNLLTVQRGGSTDVFNKSGGATSKTYSALDHVGWFQYKASTGLWYVVVGDGAVTSVAGRVGVVSLASSDLTDTAALARLASPALTGVPTAPTPSPADNSTKLATTAYVDSAVGGGGGLLASNNLSDVANKGSSRYNIGIADLDPVQVVAKSNSALTGLLTIDGYTLVNNDRVLLIGQTTGSQNGVWVAHSGAWTRPTDFATGAVYKVARVVALQGTFAANEFKMGVSAGGVTVDTTSHSWLQTPAVYTAVIAPSGGDDAAPVQAALLNYPAIFSGPAVKLTPGNFLWNSAVVTFEPSTPSSVTGSGWDATTLTVSGGSGGARGAFQFNKHADYDTFSNITVEQLTVNRNSITGTNEAHILGTVRGTFGSSFAQTRINLDHITVKECKVTNALDTDAGGAVLLIVGHPASGETQTTITDIVVHDLEVHGGRIGVQVQGGGGTTDVGVNVYSDRVSIGRIWWDKGSTPTGTQHISCGVQIGETGYGGTNHHVFDCTFFNGDDDGIEINNVDGCLVENCTTTDFETEGFFHTNFRPPKNAAIQKIIFRNCTHNIVNHVSGVGAFQTTSVGNVVPLGDVVFDNCTVHSTIGSGFTGVAGATSLAFMIGSNFLGRSVTMRNCQTVVEGVTAMTSGQTYLGVGVQSSTGNTIRPRLIIENYRSTIAGSSSNQATWEHIRVNGTWDVKIDLIQSNATTGLGNGHSIGINLGPNQIGGVNSDLTGWARIRTEVLTNDTTPKGIVFGGTGTLTLQQKFIVKDDSDFLAFPGGGTKISYTATSNAANVYYNPPGTVSGFAPTATQYLANATPTPAAGTYRIIAVGCGGGGGGGGSATTSGGVTTQAGGGGGGAGAYAEWFGTLNGTNAITITVSASGGAGGNGGAANNNPGTGGSSGSDTTVTGVSAGMPSGGLTAKGGSNGKFSTGNSTTAGQGGAYGGGPSTSTIGIAPGQGGNGAQGGVAGVALSGGGGGGGAAANATNGGNGGGVGGLNQGGTLGSGTTGTSAGATPAAATAFGAGGGGGGGGSLGGAGGGGGAGGPGCVWVIQIA